MKDLTFFGCDADLETSLFEYGLIVSNEEHEDGSGTHFCIYRQGEMFGCGHMSEKEVNRYIEGKEFMDAHDIESFLSWLGLSKDEWLELSMAPKLQDLLSYWGSENVFGTDYCPMTEGEVKERWIKD